MNHFITIIDVVWAPYDNVVTVDPGCILRECVGGVGASWKDLVNDVSANLEVGKWCNSAFFVVTSQGGHPVL